MRATAMLAPAAEKSNGPVPGMYGTLTIMSNGTFTYVLDNANTDVSALRHGATLTDTFSYQITDGTDNSPAIITVTITGVNDTPRTGGGAITVDEEATHSFALSDFDFMDADDGDALGSISISAAPSMGALSRSDGVAFTYPVIVLASEIPSLVFTPENRSAGYSASFMYTVSDNSGQGNATSAAAAMAITVTGGEDAPNLTAAGTALDGGSRGYSVGTDISTQLASAAPFFEAVDMGDVLSYGVEVEDADDAAASWLTIDATTGAFTGTVPPLSMGATYTVTVRATATPSGAESMTLSFTINVTQSPRPAADPVAVTEGATAAVTTTSDGARTNLFDNDLGLDDEGDTETLVGYSAGETYDAANAETSNGAVAGTYGSLTIMNDGTFSYALDNDDADTQALAMGTMMDDVFTYRISDRAAAHADHGTRFADGRVTVTVAGANDAPVAVGTIADVTATEDMDEAGMFTVPGTAFMDPDTGETATLTWNLRLLSSDGMSTENLPGWVMLQADRAMTNFGQVSYSPTTNDHEGTSTYRLTATDAGGETAHHDFDITVTAVNDLPALNAQAARPAAASVDEAFTYTLPADFFTDEETDNLTYSVQLVDTADDSTTMLTGWLSFAPTTRVFSGTPTVMETLTVRVTATDGGVADDGVSPGMSSTTSTGSTDLVFVTTTENLQPTVVGDTLLITESALDSATAPIGGNVITAVASSMNPAAGITATLGMDTDFERDAFVITRFAQGSDIAAAGAANAGGTLNLALRASDDSGGGRDLSYRIDVTLAANGDLTITRPAGQTAGTLRGGETVVARLIYQVQDDYTEEVRTVNTTLSTGTITIQITGQNSAPVVALGSTVVAVTEAGGANNGTAGDPNVTGAVTVMDDEGGTIVGMGSLTVSGCSGDACAPSTAGAGTDAAGAADIDGAYGTLKLQAGGVWNYTLDNECGSTNGIQGTTADAAEANDLGCATERLNTGAGNGGTETFRFLVNDREADSNVVEQVITVTGANDAPAVVGDGIDDQQAIVDAAFSYTITTGASGDFDDVDSDNTGIIFTHTVSPAASWLSLVATTDTDPVAYVFRGTPTTADVTPDGSPLTVTVTATDAGGASVTDTFTLAVAEVPNMPPTLMAAANPDIAVTEDDSANNTAMGSFTTDDAENNDNDQANNQTVTLEACADTVAGTDCTAYEAGTTAAAATLEGIYGTFTLTEAGAWSYALDNDCGTTPGMQGTTGDAGEANDPGCATNALADAVEVTDVLRVRANDGVGSATGTPGQGRSRYSAIEEVTVTVTGANDAPVLVEGAAFTNYDATEGVAFTYQLPEASAIATDPDTGDTVSYGMPTGTLPATITFDAATRTFTGTASIVVADIALQIIVMDSSGVELMLPFEIRVNEVPGDTGSAEKPTMTKDGTPLTSTDAEVDPDENAATAGVALTVPAFGYRENDTRLASITIVTLPSATEGRLVLLQRDDAGMVTEVPVTAGQVITREDLDACNLVLVSNVHEMTDVDFTFTSTATPGNEAAAITTPATSTTTLNGDDDAPQVLTRWDAAGTVTGTGVANQRAFVGRDFSYPVRLVGQAGQLNGMPVVWTRANADFDPVDYGQDLTIAITSATCAATVTDGCTMGASAIGGAGGWLEVTRVAGVAGMSTASYTLGNSRELRLSDYGSYSVIISISDGVNAAVSDSFTIQVNRRPIYGILPEQCYA